MNDPISPDSPVNPYAPPQADILPGSVEAPEDAEVVRRELLNHETSIRGIGSLYLLGAFLCGFGMVVMLIMAAAQFSVETSPVMLGGALFYALLGWISYYLGRGLRRLDEKVLIGTTILAVIGLLGFPFGTLINIYVLYLLHSQKGKRVMTPEYQAVIAHTPHIKYRTPLWLIILVVLIVAAVILGIVAAINS